MQQPFGVWRCSPRRSWPPPWWRLPGRAPRWGRPAPRRGGPGGQPTATEVSAGRYRVAARIGSGGMGEVFRARDQVLGRTVAVKVLPQELAARPGFVERFRAEAQAAARLSHPNAVQVHDWGSSDGSYFMVMEYVRARTLREVLAARGRLQPAQAAVVVGQLLAALEAAHASGLVHRDVKPENVLLTAAGDVKVTDFGISRMAEVGVPLGQKGVGVPVGQKGVGVPVGQRRVATSSDL